MSEQDGVISRLRALEAPRVKCTRLERENATLRQQVEATQRELASLREYQSLHGHECGEELAEMRERAEKAEAALSAWSQATNGLDPAEVEAALKDGVSSHNLLEQAEALAEHLREWHSTFGDKPGPSCGCESCVALGAYEAGKAEDAH